MDKDLGNPAPIIATRRDRRSTRRLPATGDAGDRMRSRLSIVVTGMIAADAGHGGATWAVLQYLMGLRRLGHRVCFIEPVSAAKLRTRRRR